MSKTTTLPAWQSRADRIQARLARAKARGAALIEQSLAAIAVLDRAFGPRSGGRCSVTSGRCLVDSSCRSPSTGHRPLITGPRARRGRVRVDRRPGAVVGAEVRRRRLARGWTQAEIGRRAGLRQTNVSRLERGRSTPTLDTMKKIAVALGCPTAALLRPRRQLDPEDHALAEAGIASWKAALDREDNKKG